MANNKLLSKLSQNLLEILNDEEYYDITIEVGDDPYTKIFRAHMVILYYRSPYLRRILSTNKRKNDETLVHIKLPNISPEVFHIILRYIYGGSLSLDEYDTSDVIKILEASKELSLQELSNCLQCFLIENKTDWMKQNFGLIYRVSFKHDSFSELQKFCTDLISYEPEKIFNSDDFTSITEKSLISLIQDDKLQLSEVQMWEHVLKWGISQNPELSSDPASYTKADFNALKNSLQQCIPFIRFYNLTSAEFSDKVLPYRKILPKDLYLDLLKYFLNPNSVPIKEPKLRTTKKETTIDSKIITFQHAELISKWITRIDGMDNLISQYEFKLLFRGSRDGFSGEEFHKFCDNQSRTVTVVKVSDSNEILGGYNPISWKSDDDYGTTKDSFIFSFKKNADVKNHILSRVEKEDCAICYFGQSGISFGVGDLTIWEGLSNSTCCCIRTDYEKPIRETEAEFTLEELEVFQIV